MQKYVLKKDSDGSDDKPKKKGNFIDRFFDDKCLENSVCSRQCLDILKVIRKYDSTNTIRIKVLKTWFY